MKSHAFALSSILSVMFVAFLATASADDAKQPAAALQSEDVYTVKQERFEIEVTLDGVFESANMTEVALRPKKWTDLSVLEAARHGTQVRQGSMLVKLDAQKLKIAILELETELESRALAIRQSDEGLRLLKKSVPLALAGADRANKVAAENLRNFLKTDKALTIKNTQFSLTASKNRLMYIKEELEQLEKMYKADDLTEETEEIILVRARNSVKSAEHYLETTLAARDRTLHITLPRRAATLKESAKTAALALEESRATLPASLVEKTLALGKLRYGQKKSQQELAKLRQDLELMVVRAPTAGVVYYGGCARGSWPEIQTTAKLLRRGGKLSPNQVFMTIVDPDQLFVRATVNEKDLAHLHGGLNGEATPTATPGERFDARIAQLSRIPIADGKFDARLKIELGKAASRIAPGMKCKVKFTIYKKDEAILLAEAAVEDDGGKHFVKVVKSDEKLERRAVRVGRRHGGRVEIVAGLKPGEKVRIK